MPADITVRVLVAGETDAARGLHASILRSDPEVVLVGEAKSGAEVVMMARQLSPTVIIMDVETPTTDALEAVRRIMSETPTPIVVVSASDKVDIFSSALQAGAVVVLPRPAEPTSGSFDENVRDFLGMVKAMSQVKVVRRRAKPPGAAHGFPALAVRIPERERLRVVAIATSTGGPTALHEVLSRLAFDFPAPILVVQHIAKGFVNGLATWLNVTCPLRVKVAENGDTLSPGTVYLAADDGHLCVSSTHSIEISNAPPVGGFRPSATVLFESVARVFGSSAVGLVLTGMGHDGVEGLKTLRGHGGIVIAQDEGSSVVFGMPEAAISAGLANAILPLSAIALELTQMVM